VFALAASGNDLYAGGLFTMPDFPFRTAIAKWDGSAWTALGSGVGGGTYPRVQALVVSGTALYAGGDFTRAGDSAANYIAKWDGSSWTALGSGLDSIVYALAVSGSNVYAAGVFTTAGGSSANHIAKWDGSSWTALGSGISPYGHLSALAVSGSDLYAGGPIAKWNGSIWSALGSGVNDQVNALAVSGHDLYAGGDFTKAGGKVSAYIARAYLPALPTLSVRSLNGDVTVSWPSASTSDFALEQACTLGAPAIWVTNTSGVTDDGTTKSVTLPATNRAQFFRLSIP
jgi:hypothetical protein